MYVREAEGGKDRDRAMREVGRACACMWLSPRMQAEEQLSGVSSLLLSHRRTVTLASAAGQHTPDKWSHRLLGDSPVSASRLTRGMLGLKMHFAVPSSSRGSGNQRQQAFLPTDISQPSVEVSRGGAWWVVFEYLTGESGTCFLLLCLLWDNCSVLS